MHLCVPYTYRLILKHITYYQIVIISGIGGNMSQDVDTNNRVFDLLKLSAGLKFQATRLPISTCRVCAQRIAIMFQRKTNAGPSSGQRGHYDTCLPLLGLLVKTNAFVSKRHVVSCQARARTGGDGSLPMHPIDEFRKEVVRSKALVSCLAIYIRID
jgi:hypothetical protein